MQLDSKRPRDGQKGSDVQNSDMDESTNDSARPLKLKRSKHSALTEINENTGRQVPTSSVVVNNVHIDSFAKQTSADSCATAYAECGSSHFSGDILSGVRDVRMLCRLFA